jgi:hypothetical protein
MSSILTLKSSSTFRSSRKRWSGKEFEKGKLKEENQESGITEINRSVCFSKETVFTSSIAIGSASEIRKGK